jgi:2-methylcitrate dehydratase PrpD
VDGPGIAAAVEVAVTLAAVGPFEHATSGVLVRNGWAGHGAMSGFTAVELASAGVRSDEEAPRAVLERALGYPLNTLELSSTFERWAIHDGYHKSYACCQYAHSAVEAALSLVAGPLADVPAGEIVAVEVATHPLALPLDDASPTTVLGGKFSVPHSVAAVLVSRSVGTSTFAGGLLGHPEVARLRQSTTISAYPGELTPPFDRPARVTVTLAGGDVLTAECHSAVGGPDRPMSDQDVLDKATLLTQATMPGFAALAAQLVGDEIDGGTPWAALLEGMWS